MIFKGRTRFMKVAAAAIALAALPVTAQTLPSPLPSQSPAPGLEQLSQQTQALHRYVSASLVRVRWPERIAVEAAPAEELIRKWEQRLEPAVRETLLQQAEAIRAMRAAAGQDDPFVMLHSGNDRAGNSLMIVRPFDPTDLARQMPLGMLNMPRARVNSPGVIGVLLDNRGLVLVPSYFAREWTGQRTVRVNLPDGQTADATFIGSDRPTGLTLLRLPSTLARPAVLAESRPAEGTLVLTLATETEAAHLAVWTTGSHDAGLVVTPDGKVAGFANDRQFLAAATAMPVIRQLAESGTVRRALLGVRVSEVHHDDALRQQLALAGQQMAMHVDRVQSDSPAERSGVRPGDLILAIDGEPVGDVPSFAAAIAARSGSTKLDILRDSEILPINVELQRK